ncbi:MAG TPA: DNA-3-methyladenine glycosylase 2 family protein [Micromonosporaceae bacterium]
MPRPAAQPQPLPAAGARAGGEVRARRRFPVPERYDLPATVGPLVVGRRDPTARLGVREFWRASRTPDGAGVVRLCHDGGDLIATGYGPGGPWLVERAEALAGLHQPLGDFREVAARHRVVAGLAARSPDVLLPRSGRVFQELLGTVLQQKVTWQEAVRSYLGVVRHFGEPAPGPVPMLLPPAPEAVAATPYWVFHRYGVEQRRADTLRRAASVAARLEETVDLSPEAASHRLRSVSGIGPWTVGELGRLAYGDPDAVSVGDYHLPHQVAYTLAGEPRADDARMLELLEPFAGHRGRVVRLVVAAGNRPPRRGPRRPLRDFSRC